MSDPTNADQPAMPAPLGEPIPTSERAPSDDLVSPPPPAVYPVYSVYPAYPFVAPPWGLDPSHAAPVYIVEAGRRSRGWVIPAAAVLVTIVVIFGALDLIHLRR